MRPELVNAVLNQALSNDARFWWRRTDQTFERVQNGGSDTREMIWRAVEQLFCWGAGGASASCIAIAGR
jgi:hypothetical protein